MAQEIPVALAEVLTEAEAEALEVLEEDEEIEGVAGDRRGVEGFPAHEHDGIEGIDALPLDRQEGPQQLRVEHTDRTDEFNKVQATFYSLGAEVAPKGSGTPSSPSRRAGAAGGAGLDGPTSSVAGGSGRNFASRSWATLQ